jgi:hypothetical protein
MPSKIADNFWRFGENAHAVVRTQGHLRNGKMGDGKIGRSALDHFDRGICLQREPAARRALKINPAIILRTS